MARFILVMDEGTTNTAAVRRRGFNQEPVSQ